MKANKTNVNRLLKTARGQLDGIIKMVEDDRYCLDVFNQILATQSILNKVNKEILKGHIENCVKESFETGNSSEKIDEILSIIDRIQK